MGPALAMSPPETPGRGQPTEPAAGTRYPADPATAPRAGPRSLRKLLEAVISVGSDLDLPVVLRRIVELGIELTGASYGALGVLDEPHTGLAEFITVGLDDDIRQRIGALPKGLGLLGTVISDARPLRVVDVSEHPGRSGFPPGHPPMTSFLGVPILVRDRVFGNLYLTDKQDAEGFTDIDEELAVGLATAAGVAIDNAGLVDQLRRREGALLAMQAVAAAVLGGADPAGSLRFVAKQARVLAHADLATFALPAADGETLVMEITDGPLGAELAGVRFPLLNSISGDVLRDGGTVVIADLSADARRSQPQVQSGAVGPAIFVALTAGERPFGTLFVGRTTGAPPFTDSDVDMVRSFAAQASVALESARQRQQLVRLSLLEDQERIARDLHDTVIQRVFAVGLSLQGVGRLLGDETARARIAAAIDDLDATIRQIRTVIFDVTSGPSASAPELRPQLLGVAREASRALGFEPAVTFRGPVDTVIDAEMAAHALATVRESLSNVARHARATRVDIALSASLQTLTVQVIDDGVGLPPDADRKGGNGLRNMRNRAEGLGGSFQLTSGPNDRGTVVEWTLPLG